MVIKLISLIKITVAMMTKIMGENEKKKWNND